jgi:hypothetical protein
MTKERILRSAFHLLGGVLFAAPAMLASFAADAHSRPHHRAHSAHFVQPDPSQPVLNHAVADGWGKLRNHGAAKPGSSPGNAEGSAPFNTLPGSTGRGAKQETWGSKETGAGSAAKDANAPDVHMKDLRPIDSRITVQPSLHAARPEMTREVKSKIRPNTAKVRQTFIPAKASRVTRNAIGLPVTPNSGIAGHNSVPAGLPAGTAPVVAVSGSNSLAKPYPGQDRLGVSRPNAGTIMPGRVANRGTINGTSFSQRGFAPIGLGGPVKTVVGINGSMIRPKH